MGQLWFPPSLMKITLCGLCLVIYMALYCRAKWGLHVLFWRQHQLKKWDEKNHLNKNDYAVWARSLKTIKVLFKHSKLFYLWDVSWPNVYSLSSVTKLYLCGLFRNKDSLNRSKYLKSAFSFPGPIFFTGQEWKESFLLPSAVQESVSLDINYTLDIELELCKIPH